MYLKRINSGINLNVFDITKSHLQSHEGCCMVAEDALLHKWTAVCAEQAGCVSHHVFFKDLFIFIYISWGD